MKLIGWRLILYLKLLSCAFFLVCLSLVAGCGQKGDLYLPQIPPAPVVLDKKSALNEDDISSDALNETTPAEQNEKLDRKLDKKPSSFNDAQTELE